MFKEPAEFMKIIAELNHVPPKLVVSSNFLPEEIPFDYGYRGAFKGLLDPVFGSAVMQAPDPCTGFERLSPTELENKVAGLELYTNALHTLGGGVRSMPYIDFGTKMLGRHNRPNTIEDPCVFGRSSSAAFTVTDAAISIGGSVTSNTVPSITLSPNSGPVGTTVTVTGTNYPPISAIVITYDGNAGFETDPKVIFTSTSGSFTASFSVPSSDAGAHMVGATSNSDFADCTSIQPPQDCPNNISVSAWGFWEFWDNWELYAAPSGDFDLGSKPPEPTTWLRRWYRKDKKQIFYREIPDGLEGLSFFYYPRKCCQYGPHYRYAVCINTEGWKLWWKQVVQWAAKVGHDGVMVDNALFRECYNDKCQSDYKNWVHVRYSMADSLRYLYTKTNNLLYFINPADDKIYDYASLEGWYLEEDGQWHLKKLGDKIIWENLPNPNKTIFPDSKNAIRGRYSCRIEVGGNRPMTSSFSKGHLTVNSSEPTEPKIPSDSDLRLTFRYKTSGDVEVTLKVFGASGSSTPFELTPPIVLANTHDKWKQYTWDFHVPSQADSIKWQFDIEATTTQLAKVWLNDFWLGLKDKPARFELRLEPSITNADPFRRWAAAQYWSFAADQKIGYLREKAREINPKFEICANVRFESGFTAKNTDYAITELKAIEKDTRNLDTNFFPGLYLSKEKLGDVIDPNYDIGISSKPLTHKILSENESLLVTNIFDYKFLHSIRAPDFTGYHMPLWFIAAGAYSPNHDSVMLNLAEAAAFGDGVGCDGSRIKSLLEYYGHDKYKDEFLKIRETDERFWNNFIKNNKYLFEGYRSYADVAIVFHDLPYKDPSYQQDEVVKITKLAKNLASRGVLWDVLTEERCNIQNFSKFKAVIYQDVSKISDNELLAVRQYLEQGGLVLTCGVVGEVDEWLGMRLPNPQEPWPPVPLPPTTENLERTFPENIDATIGAGRLVYKKREENDRDFDELFADFAVNEIEHHIGRSIQLVSGISNESLERLRVNAWHNEPSNMLATHVVNYNVPIGLYNGDQVKILNNITLQIELPPGMHAHSVFYYSPDSGVPAHSPLQFSTTSSGMITFTLPQLKIYAIVLIR
jgi:hypothetical protein